jgi:ectoine hydroxylase-related dioxygenase (phytanoyl-CoA dioxygenase family)
MPVARFENYPESGYVWPLRAFAAAEADAARRRFMDYWDSNIDRFEDTLPRERIWLTIDTHLALPWVCDLALHPAVLDAVERVLGPDVLIWNTHWFPKFPGDRSYVSWHQDATYWGLSEPDVITAWVAFTDATVENGAMRMVPGSHGEQLAHRDTFAPHNLLSRGQEIEVEVDDARGVDVLLRAGEMSLHHVRMVHGSEPNNADYRRIGYAIRYLPTYVKQVVGERDTATLVRGVDEFHHFDAEPTPKADFDPDAMAFHKKVVEASNAVLYRGTDKRNPL